MMRQFTMVLGVAAWLGASLEMWQLASRCLTADDRAVRQAVEPELLPGEIVSGLAVRYPQARVRNADEVSYGTGFKWYDVRLEGPDGKKVAVECTPAGTIYSSAEDSE